MILTVEYNSKERIENETIVLGHLFGPGKAVEGAQVRVDAAKDAIREKENVNNFNWFRPHYTPHITKDTN